jgi:ATP-dependent Clp protease ATP-binding subunit ClpA
MDRPHRDADRFDKFTERARKVLSYAQEEARRFNHQYIGTEHLLLGLLRDTDGLAAQVLDQLGVRVETVRTEVEGIIGRGDRIVLGDVGLTPRAKKVLHLAVDEARRFNHHYIGTEHLLLGLLREGEGIAAGVLTRLDVTLERARAQVARSTAEPLGPAPGGVKSNVVTCRLDDAAMDALDALVEAGVRSTRSDAAAWLIGAGIESHRALLERVNATVREIRRLRAAAQTLAEEVIGEAERGAQAPKAPPATPPERAESEGPADAPGETE